MTRWLPQNIKTQLTLRFTAILTVCLVLFSATVCTLFYFNLCEEFDRRMRTHYRAIRKLAYIDTAGTVQLRQTDPQSETRSFDEIGYFLDLFGNKGMGYWHDVGHADMNARLGIKSHKDFLESYKDKLIGVHLHGIKGRRDHLAPFDGDMNLNEFLPYFGPHVIQVIESKPFASVDLMKTAVTRFQNL